MYSFSCYLCQCFQYSRIALWYCVLLVFEHAIYSCSFFVSVLILNDFLIWLSYSSHVKYHTKCKKKNKKTYTRFKKTVVE